MEYFTPIKVEELTIFDTLPAEEETPPSSSDPLACPGKTPARYALRKGPIVVKREPVMDTTDEDETTAACNSRYSERLVTNGKNPTPKENCSSIFPPRRPKRKYKTEKTLAEIAYEQVVFNGTKARCAIDANSGCSYEQKTFDAQNYVRHCRLKHPDIAVLKGLFKNTEAVPKKRRTIAKRPIAIDRQLFLEAILKLVSFHNMPLSSLEWEGFRMILNPISESLNLKINRSNIKDHLAAAADKMRHAMKEEMRGKLICLTIDSASRHGRSVLGINVQYCLADAVAVRNLAMLEVTERQTAIFLKNKTMEVLKLYEVSLNQIFSVTVDNETNMCAAVKELKVELERGLLAGSSIKQEDNEEQDKLSADLSDEFSNHINLIRCSVHTLQLAILDVVNETNETVKAVTDVARRCKNPKYKNSFKNSSASYPPVWNATRWCGIYNMIQSFVDQESFFNQLAERYPELDLSEHWTFMHDYQSAFKPLYVCTKTMQEGHVTLPDFYKQWLMAPSEVKKLSGNQFAAPLYESLMKRLTSLRNSRAFKMALYLDPRFNFCGSRFFTASEREEIQGYIVSLWERISRLCPSSSTESTTTVDMPSTSDSTAESNFDFDEIMTEMFGGSLTSGESSNSSRFMKQLKALDVEERQSHNYDIWNHWVTRKHTHPELYAVATVVLATPSSQTPPERAFNALGLMQTDSRTGLGEDSLANIFMVKLNKDVFQKILPGLYDWKALESEDPHELPASLDTSS
ncbi:uncharacterized protein LOC129723755 [Wyeomyia smithii]|uniref:uncharacterized protein LOC129723755 n=1 Tax=Wyeomyia smithii TaxID=174621 RepID=UPI0024681882|nr:uncharacterized protein LOC129723755 [Wyeomyia smithii]